MSTNSCNRQYLSSCYVPNVQSRDGQAGLNASIYMPFFGRYFFSGESFDYATAGRMPQDKKRFIGGIYKKPLANANCGC